MLRDCKNTDESDRSHEASLRSIEDALVDAENELIAMCWKVSAVESTISRQHIIAFIIVSVLPSFLALEFSERHCNITWRCIFRDAICLRCRALAAEEVLIDIVCAKCYTMLSCAVKCCVSLLCCASYAVLYMRYAVRYCKCTDVPDARASPLPLGAVLYCECTDISISTLALPCAFCTWCATGRHFVSLGFGFLK
jgi:hypothetical protein